MNNALINVCKNAYKIEFYGIDPKGPSYMWHGPLGSISRFGSNGRVFELHEGSSVIVAANFNSNH